MGAQCCKNWCGAVYDEEVTSTANATFKEYCQPECDQVKALDVDIAARRVLIRVGGILKNIHTSQLVQAHKQVARANDLMDIKQFKQLIDRLVLVAKANQHDKYYGTTFMGVPQPRPPRPWFGSTAGRHYGQYYHQYPGGVMASTSAINSDGSWWYNGSDTTCWYDTQCQADSGGGWWGRDGGGCGWGGDSGGWGGGGYEGGGCSGGDDGGGGGCDSGGCGGGGCDSGGCGGS